MNDSAVALNDLITTAEPMLRQIIGERNFLLTALDREDGRVLAEPAELIEILMVLTTNARDAMREGGTITVETICLDLDAEDAGQHVPVPPGRWMMLEVTDSGAGAIDAARTLSLAPIHEIVSRRGGSMRLSSESGQGASITIYFPRIDAAP